MGSKLTAYALDFTSFLIQKIKDKEKIRNIILFGSVARAEAAPTSDVDIFVDLVKSDPKREKEIESLLKSFLNSGKYKNYWRLLGIKNELKLVIGELNQWKELKASIIANGILLYGKFKLETKEGKHKTFLIWENIKPNSKRVLFNKQLFGYRQNQKFYEGLLQKYKGERMGKGCILLSAEYTPLFLKLLRKYKVNVKIKKVLDYSG